MDILFITYRLRRRYWKIISSLWYAKFFKSFGKGSVIAKPIQIRGSKNISIGNKVLIRPYSWLYAYDGTNSNREMLTFGNNIQIGHFAHIAAINRVIIEDNVLIADKVYISDHNHEFGKNICMVGSKAISKGPVIIRKNCWIGEGVCILEGAEIGEGSVIGANSVVTKSIPAKSVAVGVSCKSD